MNTDKKLQDSLSKFLAQAGVASRRKVVDLIKSGVVTVNDVVIKEPGFKITNNDVIAVKGEVVRAETKVYILFQSACKCRLEHQLICTIGRLVRLS